MDASSAYVICRGEDSECLALAKKDHVVVLNLQRYNITKDDASLFFNILYLLPLLFNKSGSSIEPLERCSMHELICASIKSDTNKKHTFMAFAKSLGCVKMVDFLTENFNE